MSAPIQIVDEHDQPVRTATKQEAWARGLRHRIVRIMLDDGNGKLVLQHRSPTKDIYPNCWDCSAAGHVDAGEDYDQAAGHVDAGDTYMQAAQRELAEELGLQGVPLDEIRRYRTNGSFEDRVLNRFNVLYRAVIDADTPIHVQPEEVSVAKWFTTAEIKAMLAKRPEQFTDGMLDVMKHY